MKQIVATEAVLPFNESGGEAIEFRAGCIGAGLEGALPGAAPGELVAAFLLATFGEAANATDVRLSGRSLLSRDVELGDWVGTIKRSRVGGTGLFGGAPAAIRDEIRAEGSRLLREARVLKGIAPQRVAIHALAKLSHKAVRTGRSVLAFEIDDGSGLKISIKIRRERIMDRLVEHMRARWMRLRARVIPADAIRDTLGGADKITSLEICDEQGVFAEGRFEGRKGAVRTMQGV